MTTDMAEAPPASIYATLSDATGIRLLRIAPAAPEADVHCSLEVYDLNTAPPFEALSYVWGTVDAATNITCKGQQVLVTGSLYYALRRLRPVPKDVGALPLAKGKRQEANMFQETLTDVGESGISEGLVWIDALCINQNDHIERGRQVGMMGNIFRRAKRVIIWLGPQDEFMPSAAKVLSQLSALGPASRKFRHGTVYGYWHKGTSALAEKGLPDQHAPEWASLRELFMVPWFRRLWVIQEFALASVVSMYIGRYQVNVEVVERAVCNFSKLGLFNMLDEDAQKAYWAIDDMFRKDHIWRIRTGKQPRALWDILPQCIWFHCLDPRDRIFALLSLTLEGSREEIPSLVYPNYTKSRDEVYRDATRYCLQTTQKLQCLGYATQAVGELKLCSWSMNLERDLVLTQVCWGNSSAFDSCSILEETNDAGSLCLHGIDVGVVTSVSQQIVDPKAEPESKLVAVKAFLDSSDMMTMRPQYTLEQNANDMMNALVAGWKPFLRKMKVSYTSGTSQLVQRIGAFLSGRVVALNEEDVTDLDHLLWWSRTRRFFIMATGDLGLGPPNLAPNDQVKCLLGGPVLHVLRPQEGYHTYVGDCAMQGLMEGQTIQTLLHGIDQIDWKQAELESGSLDSSQTTRAKLSGHLKDRGLTTIYIIR